jgi:hypothetical protein
MPTASTPRRIIEVVPIAVGSGWTIGPREFRHVGDSGPEPVCERWWLMRQEGRGGQPQRLRRVCEQIGAGLAARLDGP